MSSLPRQIQDAIETFLSDAGKNKITSAFQPVGGGCINNGGLLSTNVGDLFVKWNKAGRYPQMFQKEAEGLIILRNAKSILVPEVILSAQVEDFQFIVLSYLRPGKRRDDYWRMLAERLAALHQNTSPTFGLNHDNYIGSLPQSNKQDISWIGFFTEQRLKAQLKIAGAKISNDVRKLFDQLFDKLPSLLPNDEPASLLHGDLWSGNVLVDENGEPALIDPAVYYGHREVDLAMTRLFGGFHSDFLDAYHQAFPLAPAYEERFELYNLYPLLVHVNLFGGGYLSQVVQTLKRFI